MVLLTVSEDYNTRNMRDYKTIVYQNQSENSPLKTAMLIAYHFPWSRTSSARNITIRAALQYFNFKFVDSDSIYESFSIQGKERKTISLV